MFKEFSHTVFLCLNFITVQQVFAAFPSTSTITTIHSMQEVEQYVDKDTLVLFDLDHTVFETKEYGYGHANWFYDRINKGKAKGIDEKVTIEKIFPHWLYSQKNVELKPVEAITPALIKKFQNDGVFVMGLTARQVPLAEGTIKQMAKMDVDFTTPRLPKETLTMDFNAPTLMTAGVIFCSEYNDKGTVLHAYLDKLNIAPKKIIIVDDSARHLHTVTKAYENEAVVVGLHYPLVEEYKKQYWQAEPAHKEYYKVSINVPELRDYPLEKE